MLRGSGGTGNYPPTMKQQPFSRRRFIASSVLSAAAVAVGRGVAAPAATGKIPISVQLYSVRGDIGKDFERISAGSAQ